VERFAHVHHSATVAYERSPFGVPNRDGSRMVFRSDWEDASGPVYSYVAEMPRPESGSTDIRNTAPEASILAPSIRAFPNPCRGGTNIRYTLSNDENVTLAVYNLAGQCLLTLVQGVQPAGVHTVFFDGRMPAGRTLANGVYLCRLTGSGRTQTAKMIAGP
jgi:hypothetical protein